MPKWKLKVSGSEVDLSANRLRFGSLRFSFEDDREFTFEQIGRAHWRRGYDYESNIEVLIDSDDTGTFKRWFFGKLLGVEMVGDPPEKIVYTAFGPRTIVDREIKITDTQYKVEVLGFNLQPEDPRYDASRANRQVGQIIKTLLDDHIAKIQAVLPDTPNPCYVQSDLDALATVPPGDIVFVNQDIATAIWDLVDEWAEEYVVYIDPDTMLWRFSKIDSMAELTLTLMTDDAAAVQVIKDSIREDVKECATRYAIHGRPQQFPRALSLKDGTLSKSWNTNLEATWTIPLGNEGSNEDTGTPSSQTATSITHAGKTWTSDEWKDGLITLKDGTGKTTFRKISGNGADTINWAGPHDLGTITLYRIWAAARGQYYDVWRKFEPVLAADTPISDFLTIPAPPPAGSSPLGHAGGISVPMLSVSWIITINGTPRKQWVTTPVQIAPDGLSVRAMVPVVTLTTSQAKLFNAGQAVAPDDVILTCEVVKDPLTARYPKLTDNPPWAGTAYTRFNIQREKVEHIEGWRNDADQAIFDALAQKRLRPWQDVFYRGSVSIIGAPDVFRVGGRRINITAQRTFDPSATVTTGLETMRALARSVTLRWSDREAIQLEATIELSNDRRPFRGDQGWIHDSEIVLTNYRYVFDRDATGRITGGRVEAVPIRRSELLAQPGLAGLPGFALGGGQRRIYSDAPVFVQRTPFDESF